jgi:hypothetical protein
MLFTTSFEQNNFHFYVFKCRLVEISGYLVRQSAGNCRRKRDRKYSEQDAQEYVTLHKSLPRESE